jgi:quinoprotein glucose dehydrogenase
MIRTPHLVAAIVLATLVLLACDSAPEVDYSGPTATWSQFGADASGARYSLLTQVNRENVAALGIAWEYQTGDVSDGERDIPSTSAFEATPIVVDDTMYLCSPFQSGHCVKPRDGR